MDSVPAWVELLSESERTRVVRLHWSGGRTVIRKEPLGAGRTERLRHETDILRRLVGVGSVVQLATEQPDHGAIRFDDVRGVPLADVTMPLDRSRMVDGMLAIARVVAAIHQHGVVHCDINPGNILLAGADATPCLIDFALAMTFAELRPEYTHHSEIVGTLPYLAPEQTGRTGHPVDRRADLYELGATMYELATGRPPFGTSEDPLRLIHDHLARTPVPPATVNPDVPPALSDVILHLLEKDPDSRYQTADGLIYDLERLRDGVTQLRVGTHDVAPRLSAPSRLIGREAEIGTLRAAFADALAGRCHGVVVIGEPGVGKTTLVNELRPMVAAVDGWFVTGKFDQYRRDQEYDGVRAAFRDLGRLLLAEPEPEIVKVRERMLATLGPNAGQVSAVVPEMAALLQVPPDPGDPITAQVRARQASLDMLRAVASRERPVAFVIDDLQWGTETPLGLLDLLLSGAEEVEGLFTVGIVRDGELDGAHPLAPILARWHTQADGMVRLRLGNLEPDGLAAMVGEMLHVKGQRATELSRSVGAHTAGNPLETIDLLKALQREGVLRPAGAGWRWDRPTLEGRMSSDRDVDVITARVERLPRQSRSMLETVACLGGEVPLGVLRAATGYSAPVLEHRLAPALEDGLLVMAAGFGGARFQHDRLREVVLSGLTPRRLRTLRLRLARRLATSPDQFAVAAEQYLPVVDEVHDPQERHRVADLLCQAADQAALIGHDQLVERLLAAAVGLTDDPAALRTLHIGRHAALYGLGRLAEADEVYATVVSLSTRPEELVAATRVQIASLTNRGRPSDAIRLGLDLLARLGWEMPEPLRLDAEIEDAMGWFTDWLERTSEADDLERPDVTDPLAMAVGTLISRMMPACFFSDQTTMAWLALAATRMWAERGPTRTLVGAVSHMPYVLVMRRQDYRTGYRLARRVLAVGEARDYEPDLSVARFLYALGPCVWLNPLEEFRLHMQRAGEGLMRGGDLQTAGYTFAGSLSDLDLAANVDDLGAALDAALAFAARTGNQHLAGVLLGNRWLVDVMRGEPGTPPAPPGAGPVSGDPTVASNTHAARAIVAALLDDQRALDEQSKAGMELRYALEGTYGDWQVHLTRALALAERLRSGREPDDALAELDVVQRWLADRAADMPSNFRHLLGLVEAERAWAMRDFATAVHAFDGALRDAGSRPWHRAYIAERSARFHFASGLDHAGSALLVEAREAYRAWGARAKVDQLDQAYPSVELPTGGPHRIGTRRSSISTGAIDMLAILAASQALSSETSIDALRARVVEVLSAMTGATDVGLLLWNEEQHRWLVATAIDGAPALVALDRPGPPLVPQSVLRYVERTREPVMVGDAVRDNRFARDPYFADLESCSMLAVPVLSRGQLRAIVVLENRLIRGAFSAERLEAIMLIAGQLAVSLDNALVYASLERKVSERTEQLALANERLAQLSVTDPLTGLANRRRLEECLHEEWRRAGRTRAPLTLAMVDIDHFKRYNDRHGHGAGDVCLQRVAAQLRQQASPTDLVARYGGEEFAIVMPDTDADGAHELAEAIRAAVGALTEPSGEGGGVTVSVGVATLDPAGSEVVGQLLHRADAALYDAKRAGRNRVRVAAA